MDTQRIEKAAAAPRTVLEAIAAHAGDRPDAPAIVVADGATLSYRALHEELEHFGYALRRLGVAPGDTIGIALPDGPAMALSFLATSAVAAAAPLNPNYREPEFAFEIDDLDLKAMIVGTGPDEVTAAVAAAKASDIPVVCVTAPMTGDVTIDVAGEALGPARPAIVNDPDQVALVLHTSGTTARPKIVPLRHKNLVASALAVGASLELEPGERGLNVMPLFHIHGLVAGLCSSLVHGAAVICTTGFAASAVPRWLSAHEATWYTAVPTMHQALLEQLQRQPDALDAIDLRFIRSSSSSLAPTLMAELERTFGCPVVEAYGMTEAAHQMASNPLPPAARKPGSVGPAAGPDIAIMSAAGDLLGVGEEGEVVIKGPSIMNGYAANPEADSAAFEDGWFRTGDQGRLDADGYLTLTGRLKELINRGGEKISPREVDEVLLEHAAIAQAVTFAVPDDRLGEQIAAAVVLVDGADAAERELREHVALRLAPYKVPRRIVFLDAIPKGPSGKLQRIGLADQLGLAELDARHQAAAHQPPTTASEQFIAELWHEVVGRDDIGIHDHFLDVGGDSLGATRLLTRISDEVDVEISMLDFFDAPTIVQQAALLEALLLQSAGCQAAEDPSP